MCVLFFCMRDAKHRLPLDENLYGILPVRFRIQLIPWIRIFLEELMFCEVVKNFSLVMETEGSLTCSHKPTSGPNPESYEPLHILKTYFSRIYLNIILSWRPSSTIWSIPFRVSRWNFVCISQAFYLCLYLKWHKSLWVIKIWWFDLHSCIILTP
jgi:hypothetical protein